jgi:hypothetical protein
VATANAGGYRYGVADQAFYLPAIARAVDPTLFPRDEGLFDAQTRLWVGDEIFGAIGRAAGGHLPALFALGQALTLAGFGLSIVWVVRSLGAAAAWPAALALAAFSLRHRIAKTGANSFEGYFHPRFAAFVLGLAAFGWLVRGRQTRAWIFVLSALALHPTTGAWFAVVLGVAWLAAGRRGQTVAIVVGTSIALGAAAVSWLASGGGLERMDEAWLAVLAERDYLFSSGWPAYAWAFNLGSAALVVALYRTRRLAGRAAAGERGLVFGLLTLVAGFLASVPLADAGVALVVQLQVNRVFWLVDAVAVAYACVAIGTAPAVRMRRAVLAALVLCAVVRGVYVLAIEVRRPLVEWRLPASDWHEAAAWIGAQPNRWLVLADPDHAARYGSSLRVAALRDTVIEATKDPAVAMYDRRLAARVAERRAALSGFGDWTTADVRAAGSRFGADVVIAPVRQTLDLPVLFGNEGFRVYALR